MTSSYCWQPELWCFGVPEGSESSNFVFKNWFWFKILSMFWIQKFVFEFFQFCHFADFHDFCHQFSRWFCLSKFSMLSRGCNSHQNTYGQIRFFHEGVLSSQQISKFVDKMSVNSSPKFDEIEIRIFWDTYRLPSLNWAEIHLPKMRYGWWSRRTWPLPPPCRVM